MRNPYKRLRLFLLRCAFTADFLHQWGESARPSHMRFMWDYCKEDFERSLQAALDDPDTPASFKRRYS